MTDAFEAGPVLDALVAAKVMGLSIMQIPTVGSAGDAGVGWFIRGDTPGSVRSRVPPYSTSIADAWQVVEHCRAWIFSKRQAFLRALAAELQGPPRDGYVTAFPDALLNLTPEKICRAALAAVPR